MNSNEILKKALDDTNTDLELPDLPDIIVKSDKLTLLKIIDNLTAQIIYLKEEKAN